MGDRILDLDEETYLRTMDNIIRINKDREGDEEDYNRG
jgi:hypothetical protein